MSPSEARLPPVGLASSRRRRRIAILNNLDYGVRLRDNDPEVSLIRFVLNSRILISIHSAFVTFEKTEIP